MVKRHTAEALRIAKAMRRKSYADGGGSDEIVNVAPPLGFIDRLFGKEQPVSYGRATLDQSWPSEADLATSRKYDQTYGSTFAPTATEGAMIDRPSFAQAQKRYLGKSDISALQPIDQEQKDRLETGWLAANKTALGSLGFDPRHIASTSATQQPTTVAGFYKPNNDKIWYNERYPSTIVHESLHRGIQELRNAEKLPDWLKPDMEETLVRGMMLRHFGDIEMNRGEKANEQIKWAKELMDPKGFYGGSYARNKGKSFPDMLAELESLAAKHLYEKQPRGPRADGGRTGYADGGYPTMEIDPVTGQPRLKAEDGSGGIDQTDSPSLGGISSSTSTSSPAAGPAAGPNASIGVANPSTMSPTTAATLAALQQEEAQAATTANPYGGLAGISQGPPAPTANPYGELAGITQGPPAPTATNAPAPVTANPYGDLYGPAQGPAAPAPGSTPGVQAPQFTTHAFATPNELEDNPDITGPTSTGQSISNATYGTLADQNQQVSNLIDNIGTNFGEPDGGPLGGFGSAPEGGPAGSPDGGYGGAGFAGSEAGYGGASAGPGDGGYGGAGFAGADAGYGGAGQGDGGYGGAGFAGADASFGGFGDGSVGGASYGEGSWGGGFGGEGGFGGGGEGGAGGEGGEKRGGIVGLTSYAYSYDQQSIKSNRCQFL